jgi:hypothetical protein
MSRRTALLKEELFFTRDPGCTYVSMYVESQSARSWNDPRALLAVQDVTTSSAVLAHDLDSLHTSYVRAINSAIDSGNDDFIQELAAAHDREKTALVAAHEGKTRTRPRLFRH